MTPCHREPPVDSVGSTCVDDQWPEVMNSDETARLLKMTRQTVVTLARNGELPGRKVGRDWRFLRDELFAWLAQRQPGADSKPQSHPA